MDTRQRHYLLYLLTFHRPLMLLAAVMVISTVVAIIGLVVDERMITAAPAWMKPLKFSLSIGFYSVTLAAFISLVRKGKRIVWWMGTVAAVCGALEMVAIILQVIRGRASHFNSETVRDTVIFSLMGSTIMVLWVATAIITVWLWRADLRERALIWSIRLGLVVSLIGMALAFLMPRPKPGQLDGSSESIGGHSVGVADGGPGLPLLGWSTTGGDLRIGHFIGLHALQVLPLLALGLVRFARNRPWLTAAVRTRLSLVAAGGYAGLMFLTTWQALRAEPLIYPGATTVITALVLVAAAAIGVAWSRSAQQLPVVPEHRERETVASR